MRLAFDDRSFDRFVATYVLDLLSPEPAAIPQDGVRVERRAVLARGTEGGDVLWTQRRRMPVLAPPVLELRFDVLDPVVGA